MQSMSKYIDVLGQRTHYLEMGENGSSPVILIHGGGSGADAWGNWKDCIPPLAERFHVFAIDLIGYGHSAKPSAETYDYGQTQRHLHLAAFIEALAVGRVSLIGNSMGGATSIGVAITRPELVDRLVLMGAAGIAVHNPDPAPLKALSEYDFTIDGMRRLVAVLSGPGYRPSEELIDYRYRLTMMPGAREAMKSRGKGDRAAGLCYAEDDVRNIQAQTLVIGGKLDSIAVPARIYRFLELLPNSWGFIFPHCGHWVQMESPREFCAVTAAFLGGDMFGASNAGAQPPIATAAMPKEMALAVNLPL